MPRPRPKDAPDSLPRGWLEDELKTRVVKAKITDPEEAQATVDRATSGFRFDATIQDVAHLLSRGWPEPLEH